MEVSTSEWPVVLLEPAPGGPIAEWRQGWRRLEEALVDRDGRFALLADAQRARPPSALERATVSDFLRRQHDLLERRCVGMAVAVSNPVVRAAATAVFWLAKPPMEVSFHASVGAARARLELRLGEAGEKRSTGS